MDQTRHHWPTNQRAEYTTLPEGSGVILIAGAVSNFAVSILMGHFFKLCINLNKKLSNVRELKLTKFKSNFFPTIPVSQKLIRSVINRSKSLLFT
jgi:hypothetical protein